MPKKQPQLAKLTRPRLHKAVARERLFSLLDDARSHKPAICVIGPPGAGKTTLVASWLDARGIKGIWYQVDPGDADLATFFYYLGEAARPFTRKGQRPLPLLTPEYLQDIEGFSRRFFRELFARLPDGSVLVLDNYHEVLPEQRFHDLAAQAAGEVPLGTALIAISRRDPPDAYARLMANENVGLIDWDALKLTLDEARVIGAAREGVNDHDLSRLYVESGGWAAGFTLLLEASRKQEGPSSNTAVGRDALFRYFAAQAFAKLPRARQEFLAATALFPQVSVVHANKLTGNPDTQAILEDLYRRHLFTHRRSGGVPVYWYHALFREFLLAEGERLWSDSQRHSLQMKAAQLLNEDTQFEAAVRLLCQAQAWAEAETLVLAQASAMLGQGRGETLRAWIEALPSTRVEANAWLRYWLGVSLVSIDQVQARTRLEGAFDNFRAAGDVFGQMRAASSIIGTYFFEWSHWQPLDRWIDALEPLMSACPSYPSRDIELDIHCSMLIATLYRRPGHPLLIACVQRVLELVETDIDINRKVAGATLLLTFCNLADRFDLDWKIMAIAEPLLKRDDVTPLNEVWWCSRYTTFLNIHGEHEVVAEWTSRAQETVERHGLKGLNGATVLLEYHVGYAAMAMQQWSAAQKVMQRLARLVRKTRPSDLVLEAECKIRFAMCRGDVAGALREVPVALEAASVAGMIYLYVHELATAVEVLAEAGLYEQAREHAAIAYGLIRGTCLQYWEAEFRIFEAYVEWREGERSRCLEQLRHGFALGVRLRPHWEHARLAKRVLGAMCSLALEADIEKGYVRSLVRQFRLQPPVAHVEKWPWVLKIYALGRFEIWRDDEQIQFAGKAPKKPLALLKALIAFGGRNVPEERLMDALWPAEEGDAARKSLDVTVLRLRNLLGNRDALLVSEELISLNPQLCWVDVWAFDSHCEQIDVIGPDGGIGREAFGLYRGNFLPSESEQTWAVKAREQLRAKFGRLTVSLALEQEKAQHMDKAVALYTRGLEADDLVESFYEGLMRCHAAQGRHADAMMVYRRLRQTLSVVLGIAPSEASQALARSLQLERPAKFESP